MQNQSKMDQSQPFKMHNTGPHIAHIQIIINFLTIESSRAHCISPINSMDTLISNYWFQSKVQQNSFTFPKKGSAFCFQNGFLYIKKNCIWQSLKHNKASFWSVICAATCRITLLISRVNLHDLALEFNLRKRMFILSIRGNNSSLTWKDHKETACENILKSWESAQKLIHVLSRSLCCPLEFLRKDGSL